ncbi:MAG: hypothetical protein EXR75_14520, partial [Myxococcales bacterium]|nr:hypothetical protein [Myxococcales bacterium]
MRSSRMVDLSLRERRSCWGFSGVIVVVFLGCFVAHGRLANAGDRRPEAYSAYERDTLDAALGRLGATVDAEPAGKLIEAIDVEVLDVIEERDPAPGILNRLHQNTRRPIVERELLFAIGAPYETPLIEETERNLRGLRQHSLVSIVALTGSTRDRVRVLVIVKDVWSLRLNSDYRIRGGGLEYLLLQPAEENLFGTHQRVAAQFVYKPDTLSLGGRYIEPRLAESRILLALDANAIVNHRTGETEGSFGSFQYGVPLYSTRQEWSWGAVMSWRRATNRRFIGTTLATFETTIDGEVASLPFVYGSEHIAGRVSATRSFGTGLKHDFQLGTEVDRRHYDTDALAGYDARAVREFADKELPRSVTRNGPYAQYHFYDNRFRRMHDVETLGLEESFLAGPELYLRISPTFRALGSTRNFLGYQGAVATTFVSSDALVRGALAGTVEAPADFATVFDSVVAASLRVITPRLRAGSFVLGRLFYDATLSVRPNNTENVQSTLGGEGRLRGYATGVFRGADVVASNLELRTRALSVGTVQLGGALFYDVGDAFDAGEPIRPKQGAGFGLRVLFPQLGRAIMRFDWGFPLTPAFATGGVFDGVVITFHQAYGMPAI